MTSTPCIIDRLFKGRVVIMRPMPRHMGDCCYQPSHWIRDEEDKKVDMAVYTDILSAHLFRASEIYPRASYVDYKKYLGKPFIPAMLDDNVHWSEITMKELANYVIMWLENKSNGDPKLSEHKDMEPFSTALLVKKIYVKPVKINKEPVKDSSSSSEEEGGEGGGGEQGKDADKSNPVFADNQNPAQDPANTNNGGNMDTQ